MRPAGNNHSPVQKHLQVFNAVLYLEGFDEFPYWLIFSQHDGVVEYCPVAIGTAVFPGGHGAQPPVAINDVHVLNQLTGCLRVAELNS